MRFAHWLARLRPHVASRKGRLGLLAGLVAVGAVGVAAVALATGISSSGFEDNDGNLAIDTPGNMDWNGFSPVTWTGTAPNQTATKVANGWTFNGLTDAQATTSDNGFAGGTKQDVDCATVKGSKAPNKDDLKRIYLASKTVNGHVILTLAWIRIPQNTVNASAHVGFEFNQGTSACPAGSDSLVHRTAGDMLIVYDFEGSSAGTATLSVRRWVTSGPCEISSDTAPCWGPATDLTASGFAEAKVNETPVTDTVAPGGNDQLGVAEFGEAGVDLTAAGIFQPNVCTAFGQAEGVSRSSGNSGQAAMEDLVGPGHIHLTNCGQVIIHKKTVPTPDPTTTTFQYTTTGGLDPATFGLKDGETQDYGPNVLAGSYSVTEADPGPNFVLTGLDCSPSQTTNGTTISTSGGTVSFSLAGGDVVECTYTNTLQQGALKITKTSSKAAATPLQGATFSITGPGGYSNSVTTGQDGTVCVDRLNFGTYSVTETAAPPGYAIDDTTSHDVSVSKVSTCGDGNEATFSATDTPLTDVTATATSEAAGGTQSTITCTNDSTSNDVGNSPRGPAGTATVTANGLKPGDYTCKIHIDP